MADVVPGRVGSDQDLMHTVYRQGGAERAREPHVVYKERDCTNAGCQQNLQAVDFRLEAFGRAVHDPLVRAWWSDQGFAGQCPSCHGWIHFTIQGKRAIDETEAKALPQLPPDWADEATIL